MRLSWVVGFWRLPGKPTDACRSVAVRRGQQIPDAAPGHDMAWCARVVAETVAESPHGSVHERGLVLVVRAPYPPQQLFVDEYTTGVDGEVVKKPVLGG